MDKNADLMPIRARAMEYSHNGIVISDARLPDNPIIDCNQAFEVISGYERAEVVGRNCRFLQHDDADEGVLEQIRSAIHNEKQITVVIKNYRKDGSMFWNELSISPVYDGENKLSHFIGIQNNVTARETARQELAQHNTVLANMNAELRIQGQQQKDIDERISELLRQSHL